MNPSTPLAIPNEDKAAREAEHYLLHEQAYRLGKLPTEQPHPATENLSDLLNRDVAAGLAALQSVDDDLPAVFEKTLAGEPFAALLGAMSEALLAGRRVVFTGCGATGRLAILLESMWRRAWLSSGDPDAPEVADRVRSVMAGGDFALIRSVEGFEDFTDFGRHQLREAGVAAGDVVVAVTEGGETSFVIGTAWEALKLGAASFFVFNNPAKVLGRLVERSREVIDEPRITKIDLATGPMAIAGSTRMQATTIELLVLGTALEHALEKLRAARGATVENESPPMSKKTSAATFSALLEALKQPNNVAAMAGLVEHEARVYRASGLVTYFADGYLLDVLTDTTERSPTFSLPPFREVGDRDAARSWSFVKHPLRSTTDAWEKMLGREPNGLTWDTATYTQMGAPEALRNDPPRLGRERLLRFAIGNEPDASRTDMPTSLAVTLLVGDEIRTHADADSAFERGVQQHARAFTQHATLSIGGKLARDEEGHSVYGIEVALPGSPLDLWEHIAAKLVLNTISTASMGLVGRLAGNWMVYVNTSNKKLIDRGIRLISDQAGVSYDDACHALFVTLNEPDAAAMVGRRAASPVAQTIARLAEASASTPK